MDLPCKVHPTYSAPTARRPALCTRLTQCQPVHRPTICSPFRSVTEPHHLPCIGIAVACACCAALAGPSYSKMGIAMSARRSRLAPLPTCGAKSRVHTPHASVQLSLTHSKKRHSGLDLCQSRKEMGCSTEPPARSTLPAREITSMPPISKGQPLAPRSSRSLHAARRLTDTPVIGACIGDVIVLTVQVGDKGGYFPVPDQRAPGRARPPDYSVQQHQVQQQSLLPLPDEQRHGVQSSRPGQTDADGIFRCWGSGHHNLEELRH